MVASVLSSCSRVTSEGVATPLRWSIMMSVSRTMLGIAIWTRTPQLQEHGFGLLVAEDQRPCEVGRLPAPRLEGRPENLVHRDWSVEPRA